MKINYLLSRPLTSQQASCPCENKDRRPYRRISRPILSASRTGKPRVGAALHRKSRDCRDRNHARQNDCFLHFLVTPVKVLSLTWRYHTIFSAFVKAHCHAIAAWKAAFPVRTPPGRRLSIWGAAILAAGGDGTPPLPARPSRAVAVNCDPPAWRAAVSG